MTHGSILIHDGRWRVWLHTYHTGMDIPRVIPKALDVLATYNRFLVCRENTEMDYRHAFLRNCTLERLQYAPSAASLLIAAKPCFLEIVTPGVRKNLPQWSGMDDPYVLRISSHKARWHLTPPKGAESESPAAYDLAHEIAQRLMKMEPYPDTP